MCNGISSEENQSSIAINVTVHPFTPSAKSPPVSFKHLQSMIHMVTFLVIVFAAEMMNVHNMFMTSVF